MAQAIVQVAVGFLVFFRGMQGAEFGLDVLRLNYKGPKYSRLFSKFGSEERGGSKYSESVPCRFVSDHIVRG